MSQNKFFIVNIALIVLVAVVCSANVLPRIVGGGDAPEGAFPYQVSIRMKGRHFCGGSILNENYIITAAHCVLGESTEGVEVVVGTNHVKNGGTPYAAKRFIPHKEFTMQKLHDDIALIEIEGPIKFNERVQPIALPTANTNEGAEVMLTGWGRMGLRNIWNQIVPGPIATSLQMLGVRVVSNELCQKDHFYQKVYATNICTLTKSGEGACQGDSGGPLAIDQVLIGIVSWGRPCALGVPDVFTRVYNYLDWIEENQKK